MQHGSSQVHGDLLAELIRGISLLSKALRDLCQSCVKSWPMPLLGNGVDFWTATLGCCGYSGNTMSRRWESYGRRRHSGHYHWRLYVHSHDLKADGTRSWEK